VLLPFTEHYDLTRKIVARSGVDEITAVDLFDDIHTIAKHGWPGYVDARLGMLARAQFRRRVSVCVVAIAVVMTPLCAFVIGPSS
jgi:hypothetical protein